MPLTATMETQWDAMLQWKLNGTLYFSFLKPQYLTVFKCLAHLRSLLNVDDHIQATMIEAFGRAMIVS